MRKLGLKISNAISKVNNFQMTEPQFTIQTKVYLILKSTLFNFYYIVT